MSIAEVLKDVRYVTDGQGKRTDVLVPMKTWKALLASWQKSVEMAEDQEDRAVLQEWLAKRGTDAAGTVSLDELERELIADGLLPG
jgi:hypothetical protein